MTDKMEATMELLSEAIEDNPSAFSAEL